MPAVLTASLGGSAIQIMDAAMDYARQRGVVTVAAEDVMVIFDVPDYRQIFYHFGVNHVRQVIKRGRVVRAA